MAVYLILDKKDVLNPAYILVRHMFELGVRLRYLEAHPNKVYDFLKHSGVIVEEGRAPSSQIEELLEQEDYATASELMNLPKQAWEDFKRMCEELSMSDLHKTVYRITSERSHGGLFGMPQEFLRLLGYEEIPDWEPANVLMSALDCYGMVVNINIKVFPDLGSNFANFQLGKDWHNRLDALWNDIKAASDNAAPAHGNWPLTQAN